MRIRDADDVVDAGEGDRGRAGPRLQRSAAKPTACSTAPTPARRCACSSGLLAGRPFLSVLTGDGSLCTRPMARVIEPLRAMGATIDGRHAGTLAPLTIRGGDLVGTRHTLAIASAQVKSAIVLAALQADGTTTITEPAPSRDHTERMLRALGAPVSSSSANGDGRGLRVDPVASLDAPWDGFDIDVPGDPSSAAFFAVAAVITPGSEVVLEHVAINPTRIGFVDVLRRMGAPIEVRQTGEVLGEPVGEIVVRSAPLVATTLEGDEIPSVLDEIPVLAVAAAFADGVTEIRDASELAVKESNRIGSVQQELAQLGIGVEARSDGLTIRGGTAHAGSLLKSHGDHRVAMAAAVAAHALDGAATVRGWQAVGVSYPGFADDLRAARGGFVSGSKVVAIDGPAGAGKSTVARAVADRLGVTVLDTGAMYRAVTLACRNAGIDLHDGDACAKVGAAATIVLGDDGTVTLDGADVTKAIRSPEVTRDVSIVSAHPPVRAIMVAHQRAWAAEHPTAVVEGRDIGTVVFPDAAVKVYLVASDDERARRRLRDEEAHGRSPSLDDLRVRPCPARRDGLRPSGLAVAAGRRRRHDRHHGP